MRVALASSFRMLFLASLLAFVFALFLVLGNSMHKKSERESGIEGMEFSEKNISINISRKLLQSSDRNKTNRIGRDCWKGDIAIYQDQVSPLPSGIPSYAVEIMNMCALDCSISNIHLHCGWFSSARLVNPKLFRRLGFDDCLVNDGQALGAGKSVSFQYANTFRYPLSVSSLVCLPPS